MMVFKTMFKYLHGHTVFLKVTVRVMSSKVTQIDLQERDCISLDKQNARARVTFCGTIRA